MFTKKHLAQGTYSIIYLFIYLFIFYLFVYFLNRFLIILSLHWCFIGEQPLVSETAFPNEYQSDCCWWSIFWQMLTLSWHMLPGCFHRILYFLYTYGTYQSQMSLHRWGGWSLCGLQGCRDHGGCWEYWGNHLFQKVIS